MHKNIYKYLIIKSYRSHQKVAMGIYVSISKVLSDNLIPITCVSEKRRNLFKLLNPIPICQNRVGNQYIRVPLTALIQSKYLKLCPSTRSTGEASLPTKYYAVNLSKVKRNILH